MKKLLSILSAIGLVATASTSVVSCTKTSELPTYHDVSDISGDYLSDNQIIPGLTSGAITDDTVKKMILGTIANSFKNPDEFLKDNSLELSAKLISQMSDGMNTFEITIKDSKNNSSSSSVRMKSSEKFEALKDIKPINLSAKYNDDIITSTLMGIANDMKSVSANDRKDFIDIKSNGSELMSLDQRLFNQLAYENTYVDGMTYVPGLIDNMRFKSVNEQIIASYSSNNLLEQRGNGFKDWKKVLFDSNHQLLEKMNDWLNAKNNDISNIHDEWITGKGISTLISGLNNDKKVNYFSQENNNVQN